MNHKEAFTNYVEERGFTLIPNTITENHFGVSAIIETKTFEPILHAFTQVIVHDRQDKNLFTVRLSYKDFENEAITDGFMETDCNHSDNRICQGLGH